MKRAITLFTGMIGICAFNFPFNLCAQQVSIERQVIASTGDYDELGGDLNIASTVGEVAVVHYIAVGGTDYDFTEGFQQPDAMLLPSLVVDAFSEEALCPDVHDGSLTVSPSGCLPPYSIKLSGNGDTILLENQAAGYKFTGLDSGTYAVEVRGLTLCSFKETRRVELKNNSCDVSYYNGITPNGDGRNEYWVIDNIEINQPNKVTIFNRWGKLVWEATNYDNDKIVWRGLNLNERELPEGTYFYTIDIPDNKIASKSGWIQLTR